MYRADGKERPSDNGSDVPWTPSILMPRRASRITLRISEVRIQRLHDISEADAIAEGVTHWKCGHPDCSGPKGEPGLHYGPRGAYRELWGEINGQESWAANPWVWAIAFSVLKANVDDVIKEAT